MKLKELFQKFQNWVKRFWDTAEEKTKELVPIAINVVEGLKKVMDGPLDDIVLSIVKSAIPGTADDILIDKVTKAVEKYLPIALLNLQMVNAIANISDPTEQLKAIVFQFKLSDDKLKSKAYHDFCVLVLEALADGKLSFGDCVKLSESGYETFVLKQNGTV